MEFIQKIKNKAKTNIKTIILPEPEDLRVLRATEIILKEGFAKIILLGNKKEILENAKKNGIDITEAEIMDTENFENIDYYINELYELRKNRGVTLEEAADLIKNNSRYLATLMVKIGEADGFVSGASHSTADTLKPVLRLLKSPKSKTVSAFFIMDCPNKEFGENGLFVFADSGLNENPTAEKLSDIAISSGESFRELVGVEPKIAMLSYSTKGSASSPATQKVIDATNLVHKKAPHLLCDGELQVDAAIIPEIAKFKAPDSPIKGEANVLVFPDLGVGNIAYKLVQRLSNAKAYGPMCQGLEKPVNDLSRGCSIDDIVGVVAITCVQAQNIEKGD